MLVCCIFVLCQKLFNKSGGVSLFGYSAYIVASGSMQPEIEVGDVIVITKSDEEEIEVGDVVTFIDANGNVVTHRITQIMINDGVRNYVTKGDYNGSEDVGLITYKDIRGKFSFKISQAGRVLTTIFTPVGMIMLLLFAVLVYVNSSRLNDRRAARHEVRKRYTENNAEKDDSKT